MRVSPLELQVLLEIGLEWSTNGYPDTRYLNVLNLDHNVISSISQIEKAVAAIAGNRLAVEEPTVLAAQHHLQGKRLQTACLALVDLDVSEKSMIASLSGDQVVKQEC